MENGMELVYFLVGAVIILLLFYVFSGPRDTVKRAENVRTLTDESLSLELNRILNWLHRYNGLDEKWKVKAATPDAAQEYNNYFLELNEELSRRKFFYELIEYSPTLKMLLPSAYCDLLNDGVIKIAWDLKQSGTPMSEIIVWYKKELGIEDPPGKANKKESSVNDNLCTLSNIIKQIPPFIIFRFEPNQTYLIAKFESLGISHEKYTHTVFISAAAFCFSQITDRPIFSKSEDEIDHFLYEVCGFDEFKVLEDSKSFVDNCKEVILKIVENPTADPRVIVNRYFEKVFPVQNNDDYEMIHGYFNHWHIRPIVTAVNDAFLRSGYVQYV
jgi:hypothetical protein